MHVFPRPAQPPLVGSRTARLRSSHSYGVVLALVIGSFVLAATLPDDDWAVSALLLAQCATLVTAIWTSGLARANSGGSIAVSGVVLVAAVAPLATDSAAVTGAIALATSVLVALTIAVIALGVADQGTVNAQSVRGAICVYVLLGLLFVFLYGAVAMLGDGPFFAQGTDGTRALRVYFSFVTLATLGYGDYTASSDLGHTLAVVEALVGQLYLVTVVALLVSRIGVAQAGMGRRPRTDGSPHEDEGVPADPS
jgi:hypothetical protein